MSDIVKYGLTGFIVIAIISVIVSKNSSTPNAIQAFGSALTSVLGSIVAPVSAGGSASTSSGNSAISIFNPTSFSAIVSSSIQALPTGH